MELFDSHAHLDRDEFSQDVDAVVARARAAGVTRITTIGSAGGARRTLDACADAIGLAERYDAVWATVGIHPHDAASGDDATLAAIVERAAHPKVCAIGETGLDYHYLYSPREEQLAAFRRHVQIAREVSLPLVIHNRDADEDCIDILRDEGAEVCGGVIHCFSSGEQLARVALDLGFYISFSGILTFKNADDIRAVARWVPRDRLLVETDSPFLAPPPHRGRRNEPAFVVEVARRLAEVRGEPLEALAEALTANTCRFYGVS